MFTQFNISFCNYIFEKKNVCNVFHRGKRHFLSLHPAPVLICFLVRTQSVSDCQCCKSAWKTRRRNADSGEPSSLLCTNLIFTISTRLVCQFWFQISKTSKELLDSVGGFRCEHRGIMDLPVRIMIIVFPFVFKYECVKVFLFGGAYLGLLNTNFTFYLQNHPPIETYWLIGPDRY